MHPFARKFYKGSFEIQYSHIYVSLAKSLPSHILGSLSFPINTLILKRVI